MVERKLFKTKLCVLYQRGRCSRQNCSFAHGTAELRQYLGSYNDKRDYRGGDLRNKLDMRLSPRRRYYLGKDARGGQHMFHGSSASRSPERSRDRKRRRKQIDDRNDFPGGLKISDGAEDRVKERKNTSSDSRALKEQLKEVQSDIDRLDCHKSNLKILVEEKVEEAHRLDSMVQELDSQLTKEKEKFKSITSKVEKFVKAHRRYVRAQDELRRQMDRSQVRLQELGDQLGSHTTLTGGNEVDSSINIVSDGEPQSEGLNNSSPSKKSVHEKQDNAEESIEANGIGYQAENVRLGKLSESNAHPTQLNINKEVVEVNNRNGGHQPVGNEGKQKRVKSVFAGTPTADKLKGHVSGFLVPSTSMAAHAVDELVEIDMDENIKMTGSSFIDMDKRSAAYEVKKFPVSLPPPPPVPRNIYSQCKDEDENVDVEGIDEEMVHVEIV